MISYVCHYLKKLVSDRFFGAVVTGSNVRYMQEVPLSFSYRLPLQEICFCMFGGVWTNGLLISKIYY